MKWEPNVGFTPNATRQRDAGDPPPQRYGAASEDDRANGTEATEETKGLVDEWIAG